MVYKFLIVDNESAGREYICDLVQEFVPDAVIRKTGIDKEAADLLTGGNIDILFLNVPAQGAEAFRFLNSLPHRDFELVIISASSENAINAIKEGAVDYLLRPVRKPVFRETLQKVMERRSRYLAYYKNPSGHIAYLSQKVSIPHQQGIWFVTLRDIIYLKADNSYTTIYTTSGQKITTSKPISHFENTLDMPWFFRIHKSYIINTDQFKEYLSKNGDIAVMSNGDKLLISRYRLGRFLEIMRDITVNQAG